MQYANDTVIMVGGDPDSIKNMKFLLYCFEWMSGLKINYHKSEMITFGMDDSEQQHIANNLNCNVGKMPMRYLGFPISSRNIGVGGFKNIANKMRKKLQPWKGKHLSSGGRLILTNSSLSSMPTYTMGMFLLQDGVHKQMDTIRSQFFWRGDSEKFKYHMMKWENVRLPKDFGGLGITNTRIFNESILMKWVWRLYASSEDDLCCQLLKQKYLKRKPILCQKGNRGSQFWRGLNKIKHGFSWGAVFEVKDGKSTRFWEDVWRGDIPLKIAYPKLYELCNDKTRLVSDFYDDGEWYISFRRSLGGGRP